MHLMILKQKGSFMGDIMGKALPCDCRWILKKDWNTVESNNDKINECGHLTSLGAKLV